MDKMRLDKGDWLVVCDGRKALILENLGDGMFPNLHTKEVHEQLRHALAIPDSDVGLFYSVRTPDEFVYQGEFRALAAEGLISLRQTVTRGSDLDWDGARGRLDRVMLSELVHDPATLSFVCGPPALVSEMRMLLGDLGIADERIRMEAWS